jgi:hypothetical protein
MKLEILIIKIWHHMNSFNFFLILKIFLIPIHKLKWKSDAPPSSLCDPKWVQRVGFAEMVRNLVPLSASNTKRGRGVVLEAPGLD